MNQRLSSGLYWQWQSHKRPRKQCVHAGVGYFGPEKDPSQIETVHLRALGCSRLVSEHKPWVDDEKLGLDALLSVPTPEYYFLLLYVIATRRSGERVLFPVEGVDGGSIFIRSVQIGQRSIE